MRKTSSVIFCIFLLFSMSSACAEGVPTPDRSEQTARTVQDVIDKANELNNHKTLGTTLFGFTVLYEYTMGKLNQKTSVTEEAGDGFIALDLTPNCAALVYMDGDEISEFIHVGDSDGKLENEVSVKISMCASILSLDPSVEVDEVVDLINTIMSDSKEHRTAYNTYSYASDEKKGNMILSIAPN